MTRDDLKHGTLLSLAVAALALYPVFPSWPSAALAGLGLVLVAASALIDALLGTRGAAARSQAHDAQINDLKIKLQDLTTRVVMHQPR